MRVSIFSMIVDLSSIASASVSDTDHTAIHAQFIKNMKNGTNAYDNPHSLLMVPVFEKLNDRKSSIVGMIFGVVAWDRYLTDLLPEGTSGMHCILKNDCGQTYTYALDGTKVWAY